jgi:hypothetical protein
MYVIRHVQAINQESKQVFFYFVFLNNNYIVGVQ